MVCLDVGKYLNSRRELHQSFSEVVEAKIEPKYAKVLFHQYLQTKTV